MDNKAKATLFVALGIICGCLFMIAIGIWNIALTIS